MEKIGSSFKAVFFLILAGILSGYAHKTRAQSADVQATVSETKVFTGERISLSIEISGKNFNNISRPQLPDFDGFRLLSNTPSTSRSFSFVNGKSSTKYSYTYYLIAQQKGSYKIPPIDVTIDGHQYQTKPIDVTIMDRNESARNKSGKSRPDIFVRMEVTDQHPVTGQQIIANLNLYFKDNIEVNSYQPYPGWKAEGFWKEQLESNDHPRANSVILNGVRYRKARLLQYALFPTKSGKLTLSSYKVAVSARSAASQQDPFSSFFGGFGTNQRNIDLKSDPVTVNVKSLPPAQNVTYTGAVGNFNIQRTINSRNVQVGETIELTTTIKGTGNVPLISKPEYNLPKGFEIYDPQESQNVNRDNKQISGSKTFTDVLIARKVGTYKIPETTLAYYNATLEHYKTKTLPAITIHVSSNPDAIVSSGQNVSFSIQPVTGLASWNTVNGTYSLVSHWWFWIGLAMPLFIFGVGYWQKQYHDRMNTDRQFARSQTALDNAYDKLKLAAEKGDQNIKEGYGALHQAITGYIGDRLSLAEAGLSDEEYLKVLREKDIATEIVNKIRQLLSKCATIRYAPNTTREDLSKDIELAKNLLSQLKKSI